VDQESEQLIEKHSYIAEAVKRVCTIPGIGRISAVTVLAETNFFLDFNNAKQVTKYAGLDIILKESGTFKGKRHISKRGNSYLRAALYMPSLSAVRYNKPIKELYDRITDKCSVKMKGLIAGCRKLLCLMYSMEKTKKILIAITTKNVWKKPVRNLKILHKQLYKKRRRIAQKM